jgi:hypothetical protein
MAFHTGAKAPEPISLPDVRRLDRMPFWPAWVASRVALMKDERQTSTVDGKYRTVPTLPANLTLGQGERAEIEKYVAALDALCAQTPDDDDEWAGATLIIITRMMLALPAPQQNDAAAEATGEAFQAALDEVPHWAVAAAVRQWYRGDCGTNERGYPYDYHWRPAPAELRRIALSEVWRVKRRALTLRKLLAAEPLIEFSPEHCQRMRERFGTLMKELNERRAQAV